MKHDPMCRKVYQRLIPADRCTDCDLIERVRSDERRRLGDGVWAGHHCEDRNGCPVCTTVMKAIAIREHPAFTP